VTFPKSNCAGAGNVPTGIFFCINGMFAFALASNFVRKATGKLLADGNFAEEANFHTNGNFAREGELTKESEFAMEGNFAAKGNCNMVTSLLRIAVWLRTRSPPRKIL
jgi:hypothetical protein